MNPDRAAIETYLGMLFGYSEGTVAVRRFAEKGDSRKVLPHTPFFTAGHALAAAVAAEATAAAVERLALYIIPCTTRGHGHAKAEDMVGTEAIVVDLDCGNVAAKYDHLVTHLGLPTMEVFSGGLTEDGQRRVHLYWRLSEPALNSELAKAVAVRGAIAAKVGGDPSFEKPASRSESPARYILKAETPSRSK